MLYMHYTPKADPQIIHTLNTKVNLWAIVKCSLIKDNQSPNIDAKNKEINPKSTPLIKNTNARKHPYMHTCQSF